MAIIYIAVACFDFLAPQTIESVEWCMRYPEEWLPPPKDMSAGHHRAMVDGGWVQMDRLARACVRSCQVSMPWTARPPIQRMVSSPPSEASTSPSQIRATTSGASLSQSRSGWATVGQVKLLAPCQGLSDLKLCSRRNARFAINDDP